MEIGLYYNTAQKVDGCIKLARNLVKGMQLLGHNVLQNKNSALTGCVHGNQPTYMTMPGNTLMGPELHVTPNEEPFIYDRYKYFVQPSEWVREYFLQFPNCKGKIINIWPCGIDTDIFCPQNDKKEFDCLVYYKSICRDRQGELNSAITELKKRGLSYKIIKYGTYTEPEFLSMIHACRFCIFITATESQCIALMEITSCGIPCYVLDFTEFAYFDYRFYRATSAPYFSADCGIKTKDFSMLDEFIKNIDNYRPDKYIAENHNLRLAAQNYINILQECV